MLVVNLSYRLAWRRLSPRSEPRLISDANTCNMFEGCFISIYPPFHNRPLGTQVTEFKLLVPISNTT